MKKLNSCFFWQISGTFIIDYSANLKVASHMSNAEIHFKLHQRTNIFCSTAETVTLKNLDFGNPVRTDRSSDVDFF